MKRCHVTLVVLPLLLWAALGWAGGDEACKAAFQANKKAQYEEAVRLYTEGIEAGDLSKEDLASAYFGRAFARKKILDLDGALTDYDQALAIQPELNRDEFFHHARGDAWRQKGDYDRALTEFNQVIAINPKSAAGYTGRGVIRSKRGEYSDAIADHYKAIELSPDYFMAYSSLAWLLATCPDEKYLDAVKAVELAQKAVDMRPFPSTIDALATAYARAGRFQEAVTLEEQLIDAVKGTPWERDIPEFTRHLEAFRENRPWRE